MLPENILLSDDAGQDLKTFLQKKNYSRLAVLVDENTHRACYPLVEASLPPHFIIEVKSGEQQKNIETCVDVWQNMTDNALDRHSCMLILGGGVLGDMGGFCAATYKRGIEFILVPTTLLAQVDASIGGKLGIDFDHYKNHIGVFQQPILTLLYDGFLSTLPEAEIRSGFAEIIKHALISDTNVWREIESKELRDQPLKRLIRHSVEFKAKVITEDPRENGLRKILNAGHTIGHAIESHRLAQGKGILHGEAVAAGLLAETHIAANHKLVTESELKSIASFILRTYGKVELADEELTRIAQLTLQDKKNKNNKILCVLLDRIGKAKWDCEISLESVTDALKFYQAAQI
jgi:3-dehydroquinate synthase